MSGQQTVITTDALELMVLQTQLMKDFIGVAKELIAKLDETKLSMIQPEFLTTEQVAAYINFKPSTLNKYHTEGVIGGRTPMPPSVKIGDKVRYPKTDLEKWGAEQPRFYGQGKKGGETK